MSAEGSEDFLFPYEEIRCGKSNLGIGPGGSWFSPQLCKN